jgi:molybdopterin biosynthesis enzyme
VSFQVAIRHALDRLEGAPPSWAIAKIALAEDLRAKPNERETFWPAHVAAADGILQVRPLAWQSSGDLRGLLGANGLLPIAPGSTGAKKGEQVDCLLLGGT